MHEIGESLSWNHFNPSCRLSDSPDVAAHLNRQTIRMRKSQNGRIINYKGRKRLDWQEIKHFPHLLGFSRLIHFPLHRRYRHFNHREISVQHHLDLVNRLRSTSYNLITDWKVTSRGFLRVQELKQRVRLRVRGRSPVCLLLCSTYKLLEQTPADRRIQAH